MEFVIQPIEASGFLPKIPIDVENLVCPGNAYQCGCNTVQGCACSQ
jgi:hypothetical protein